jgi:hypothetical protein
VFKIIITVYDRRHIMPQQGISPREAKQFEQMMRWREYQRRKQAETAIAVLLESPDKALSRLQTMHFLCLETKKSTVSIMPMISAANNLGMTVEELQRIQDKLASGIRQSVLAARYESHERAQKAYLGVLSAMLGHIAFMNTEQRAAFSTSLLTFIDENSNAGLEPLLATLFLNSADAHDKEVFENVWQEFLPMLEQDTSSGGFTGVPAWDAAAESLRFLPQDDLNSAKVNLKTAVDNLDFGLAAAEMRGATNRAELCSLTDNQVKLIGAAVAGVIAGAVITVATGGLALPAIAAGAATGGIGGIIGVFGDAVADSVIVTDEEREKAADAKSDAFRAAELASIAKDRADDAQDEADQAYQQSQAASEEAGRARELAEAAKDKSDKENTQKARDEAQQKEQEAKDKEAEARKKEDEAEARQREADRTKREAELAQEEARQKQREAEAAAREADQGSQGTPIPDDMSAAMSEEERAAMWAAVRALRQRQLGYPSPAGTTATPGSTGIKAPQIDSYIYPTDSSGSMAPPNGDKLGQLINPPMEAVAVKVTFKDQTQGLAGAFEHGYYDVVPQRQVDGSVHFTLGAPNHEGSLFGLSGYASNLLSEVKRLAAGAASLIAPNRRG